MREIKFRCWDKSECRMIYLAEDMESDTHLEINNHSWGVFEPDKEDYYGACTCNKIDGDILMQYTGLKDKNGKGIYEGDIVKRPSYTDCNNHYYIPELFGVVKFDGFAWCIIKKQDNRDFITTLFEECEFCDVKSIEVIGNIYENPELLKEVEEWED